jgi:hypothetical protein
MATGEKAGNWGKFGGSTKMHSFDPVGAQQSGVSSVEGSGGSRTDIKVKPGPSSVMGYSESGNKSHAGTQTPGQSSSMPSGDGGKFAKGGSGNHMFGNRGSSPAKGGSSAP